MASADESARVPVVVVGRGPLAGAVSQAAIASDEVELVGVVPGGEATSSSPLRGVPVHRTLAEAVGARHPVVVEVTGADVEGAAELVLEAVSRGCPVVTACPELAFPHLGSPALATRIERAALKARVAVVGPGVVPGLVMVRVPALVGQCVGPVRTVVVRRVVDLRTAPDDLRQRCGLGLGEQGFIDAVDRGDVGVRGLLESVALCALGVGLECDDFEEEHVPLLSLDGEPGVVAPGEVAGLTQTAVGLLEEVERVRLELTLEWGATPLDTVELHADQRLSLAFQGGVGEGSAAHLLVHAAPRIVAAEPGLLTVLDLPTGR